MCLTFEEELLIEQAADQLTAAYDLGIRTIFDPTVWGLGRDIDRIVRIADRTPLNIVLVTGIYTHLDVPPPLAHLGPGLWLDRPERLTELFVTDLQVGIGNTGVRAGFLKCAIDEPGLTPGVERVLRCVARASIQTGAPILVHTNSHAQTGTVAQQVFADEGVDLTQVVIGHAGNTRDLDYLQSLADHGSILGFDQFGLDISVGTADRIDTIRQLISRGYVGQIVLSHDATSYSDLGRIVGGFDVTMPNWHIRYLSEGVLPLMKEAGISDSDIESMLVSNPRRLIEPRS